MVGGAWRVCGELAFDWISILYWCTHTALIVFGASITIVVDGEYHVRLPPHWPNRYRSVSPSAGLTAEIGTTSFSGCHPLPGLTVPTLDDIVRKYSVVNTAVSVLGWSA